MTTTGSVDGTGEDATTASTGAASTTASDEPTSGDRGALCPSVLDPVCGEDGQTYDNSCVANAAGVAVKREGPCFGDCEGCVAAESSALPLLLLGLVALTKLRRT